MKFSPRSMFLSVLKGGDKNQSEGAPKDTSRQMKFPYTFSAKMVQFPAKFYINNNWMWKYYCFGFLVSLPIFYKIQRMSNSEENVEKWREIKERENAEHH